MAYRAVSLALILGTLISEIINVLLIILFIHFSIKNKSIIKFMIQ